MRVTKTGIATATGIGSPDYAAPKPVGQVPIGPIHTLTDLGELAVRLDAPNLFDRRGNVLFFDRFDETLTKWKLQTPAGGSIVLSTEASRAGVASAKFTTPNLADEVTYLQKFLPLPALSNIGFEFSWMGGWDVDRIMLSANFTTADLTCLYFLRYTIATEIFSIWKGGWAVGSWFDLSPTVAVQDNLFAPNTLKLVLDWPNAQYERLLINDREFDISDYGCQTSAGGATHRLVALVQASTGAVSNATVYISDFILTQNEPDNLGV